MNADRPGSGSTVRRILLGSQLRRLRESRGISREEAGYAIRASESKIGRMELGRVSFKERDVNDLLTLYGVVNQADREPLLEMTREANAPSWWHRYNEVLPGWFQTYVGLEESASLIRTYEVQFVPGLLQTEGYARAIFRLGHPEASAEEIEQRVDLRMRRQERLLGSRTPRLWAVIDEAALRRPIGGPEVMREQFQRLHALATLPHITIQVMPFSFGGHPAEGGAFSILRFPERDVPDVVYIENLTGALYLDRDEDVESYQGVMERLCVNSAAPNATAEVLDAILERVSPPVAPEPVVSLPSKIGSLRTAGRSVTGAETPAGDVLDAVSTPFGVRLVIGKVSGSAPKRLARDVLLAFRDLAEQEPLLSGVADRLNAAVARSGHLEGFVTAMVATIRDREGQAEFVCCGHPPPLLVHGTQVSPVGALPVYPPLGLLDSGDEWCESTTVPYGEDDRLLFYTQGVSRARDDRGRDYPLAERAAELVRDDPDAALAALAEDLLRHSAGPVEGDATFLLVQGDHLHARGGERRGVS